MLATYTIHTMPSYKKLNWLDRFLLTSAWRTYEDPRWSPMAWVEFVLGTLSFGLLCLQHLSTNREGGPLKSPASPCWGKGWEKCKSSGKQHEPWRREGWREWERAEARGRWLWAQILISILVIPRVILNLVGVLGGENHLREICLVIGGSQLGYTLWDWELNRL